MTINDIARICGVSKGTVNRALHDKPGINKETKEKIVAAVREYGFRPDYRAKSLATGKTLTIGLLLPNIENQSFAMISTMIEREFWERGYFLNLALSNDDAAKEERYLELFIDRRVDGLVIFPVNREPRSLQSAIAAGIPTVLMLNDLPGLEVGAVLVEERKAVAAMTRYVLSLGHERIAYLDGFRRYTERYNDYINRERFAGFSEAVASAGLDPGAMRTAEFDPAYYGRDDLGPLSGLFSGKEAPSAAVCFHDRIAVWLLSRLETSGIKVPERLSLTGFDDIEELQSIKPALTTLRNPFRRVAQEVIRLLVEGIEAGEQPRKRVFLEAEPVIRESCQAFCSTSQQP
jgi:DNA-binding LacI/PurR family transcriptional regulator